MPKKKINKFELPRKSLKEISKSHSDIDKDPVYPVKRKMKFIDFDSTVDILQNMGWMNITSKGIPSTPDTVAFKGDNIIPMEIKWRNKSKPVSEKSKKGTVESLARKLATFSANLYKLHKRLAPEYWMILSFPEKEDISKDVREMAIKFIEECKWLTTPKPVIESVKSMKIKMIEADSITDMKLDGRNKSPKWFVKIYESSETKATGLGAKATPPKKVKATKKAVAKKEMKTDKSQEATDLISIAKEFRDYRMQQLEVSKKFIKAINQLTSEVSVLRKESKKREVTIKTKG